MQRQNFASLIRFSRVLWFSLFVVMLGSLLEPAAADQTVSFGAKTDFGTGIGPTPVAVGDLNGDGKLDLAVAKFDSNTVSILLGTGTSSFGAKTDFATGSFPGVSIAVGDFNDDGNIDLAVANNGSSTVSILLGTGTGSFGAKTDFATGSGPFSVAAEDFNGDDKLDLATANFRGNSVSILLNTPLVFSIGFDSPTVTAQRGTKANVTVNINRSPGFIGNVTALRLIQQWASSQSRIIRSRQQTPT